jgi:Dimerisation domain
VSATARLSITKPEAAAKLLELIQMRLISEAIHVAATLGVADLLAAGPKSAEELGNATGANVLSLRPVMRALASFGIFSQDSDDRFVLALPGEFLQRDVPGSLHSAALFFRRRDWNKCRPAFPGMRDVR